VLTEAAVEKSFRQMFSSANWDEACLDRAEELLEELRPESPLRHRLSQELEELREMANSKS
jgi:hypothetical protein